MIGQTLGHFEILEKLGEGGMGVVYKAHDTHLDRLVAIKVLSGERAADLDRRRFVQEAKTASSLNHPGIVTIHDITRHNGIDFIAMELVPGRTLDRVIPRHGLAPREALEYGVQIADALAAAHSAGVVHRDLKPANVIVSEHGRVKVLDFGLAKLVGHVSLGAVDGAPTATHAAPFTEQGAIVGTVAYMSPEQAESKPVDTRTDVFSFGCVLYEMVTGQRAFQRDSAIATLSAILHEEPKPISQLSGRLPPEVERVIARCLRKDPERRWQSMADVKVALQDLKEELDSGSLVATSPAVGRPRRVWLVVAGLAVLTTAAAIGAFSWRGRTIAPDLPAASFTAVPLTTYPGREQQATFSPDGNSVAFSWNGEREDNWDIYVKLIGPGSPQQLTTDLGVDMSPAWSPDGGSIAFVRIHPDRATVMVVPSRGGPERSVLELRRTGIQVEGQLLSWSPDSRFLVVVAASSSDEISNALTAVDVASGKTHRLTTSPPGATRDVLPSVSPDGATLAFVRRSAGSTGELWLQPLSATFLPIGEPARVGAEALFYHGVAWSRDGRDLIVSSGNTGNVGLWRVPVQSPGNLRRLSPTSDEWRQPAVSMQHDRLAFTRTTWDENLWRLALEGPGRPAGAPVSLMGSTRLEMNAQFSPDGSRIVFESLRSGTQELWVADRDERNALQLTSFEGRRGGTPAWSPNGQSIAFDLRTNDERADIYVIPARGGTPVRVTTHAADDLVPSWSRDGLWIYFGSTRSGRYEIWKVAPGGGEPVRVTQQGGTYAKESVDGRNLYYARMDTFPPTLWRVAVSGGEEVTVVRNLAYYGNFAVARDGIYFESSIPGTPLGSLAMFTPFSRPGATLEFLSFATGKVSRVLTLDRHAGHGFDVSPHGRTLLFGVVESFTEDLMLIENFR
jgi:serine/threonine protein kinase